MDRQPVGERGAVVPRFIGRIKGTINDEFEVDAENVEEAIEMALMGWRYVEFEFEDLEVETINEMKEEEDEHDA